MRAALWRRVPAGLLRDVVLAGASLALDLALFAWFYHLSGHVVGAVFAARLLSALFNFLGNRWFVFQSGRSRRWQGQLFGYAALALLIVSASAAAVHGMVDGLGWPALPSKFGADVALYVLSFLVRKHWLFANATKAAHPPPQD